MAEETPSQSRALEEAFNTFNQLSRQLTESYRLLESRVTDLNQELAAAHDERYRELTEKERLANRLALLLDVLPGGVVVLDGQGQIQEHNPAAGDLLGEPLLQQPWSAVIGRAFAPGPDDGTDVSLRDGRRVNISTCPLGAEPGQILLLMDVTEIRRMQDRLNQQQRLAAMGETAASLAHQIRTPIASALLYASQLKRQHLKDEDRIHAAEKIFSRLRHLEQVIENMLMYARRGTVSEESFTAGDLFRDLQANIETSLRHSDIQFAAYDDSDGCVIQGNRQMLLSGLLNLAMNAIQVMPDGGRLTVRAESNGPSLVIRISDTGPGIAADKREEIFSPFYTTRKDGTGLGLAVVEAITRNHKGRIELESQPGEGSTFILYLPIQADARQQAGGQLVGQLA
ncbi:sensor histidine kinase [Thiohalophilus sp.]|uniref:sensor histidine kinase n=1 Tax=Thiohalophilus sp. TaxID=3028392 RepID=UPI0039756626